MKSQQKAIPALLTKTLHHQTSYRIQAQSQSLLQQLHAFESTVLREVCWNTQLSNSTFPETVERDNYHDSGRVTGTRQTCQFKSSSLRQLAFKPFEIMCPDWKTYVKTRFKRQISDSKLELDYSNKHTYASQYCWLMCLHIQRQLDGCVWDCVSRNNFYFISVSIRKLKTTTFKICNRVKKKSHEGIRLLLFEDCNAWICW